MQRPAREPLGPAALSGGVAAENSLDGALDSGKWPSDWAPCSGSSPGRGATLVAEREGVALYREDEGGRRGAGPRTYLCCTTLPVSPRDVFDALQDLQVGFNCVLSDMTILETESRDDASQVLHCYLRPEGSLAPLFSERDLVLRRTVRADDDGALVVSLSSVEHALCPTPQPKCGLGWFSSRVRAQVRAATYSIVPLLPDPSKSSSGKPPPGDPRDAKDCQLTFVISLDVGGAVGWFGSYSRDLEDMWLWPLVNSISGIHERIAKASSAKSTGQGDDTSPPRREREDMEEGKENSAPEPRQTPEPALSPLQRMLRVASGGRLYEGSPSAQGSPRTPRSAAESQEPIREETPAPAPFALEDLVFDRTMWNSPGAANFKVRGGNYLVDKKKAPSEEPAFELERTFLLNMDDTTEDVAKYLLPPDAPGFTFVVNIMMPTSDHPQLVMFFKGDRAPRADPGQAAADDADAAAAPRTPFETVLERFCFGDGPAFDTQRNGTFKIIPSVVKGSWIIKSAVGATPVLLGNKLRQAYHRGPNYFEVDVDIGSDPTARYVVGMVQGATKSLVVDVAVLLEGHTEQELPEQLLGSFQINHLDMKQGTRVTQQQLDAMAAANQNNQK